MHSRRLRVAVVYGGRSGEHEVSIESAASVISAIDQDKYDVIPLGITHAGAWVIAEPKALLAGDIAPAARVLPSADPAQPALVPLPSSGPDPVAVLEAGVDVVFPLVHGTYGEDGCLQGLFELAGVPCVGAGVLGSAVGMDKIMMKTVFRAHGLPVVDYLPLARTAWERDPSEAFARIEEQIGFPCFVKPSNLGSSVGITRVRRRDDLTDAIQRASEYSARLIVERAVDAREVECGVLGNEAPSASVVGEVIPEREFYDYFAKYHDDHTCFVIPAALDDDVCREVQSLALRAFAAIAGAGMARVDFFIERGTGTLYVNEINTIPGFTAMSVYPRLWAASGVPYPELIDRLIHLALERHADQERNRTRYDA
ncbi:MAG: D-alanine--D-alanine ligase [Chloroflexi bacterium]|nr:D-alanine--D-alanine ligase [Chloroflexota bacterium]